MTERPATRDAALPARTAAAVIGAGVIGCAVALQLSRAGLADVVVVDRAPAAGWGSSGRANGGVRAQFTTAVNIEFSRHTIAALAELDRRSGGVVAYRPVGYLFLTGTATGERALEAAVRLQRSLGVDAQRLDAAQALRLMPPLRGQGLRAASFCAGDGLVDPHGVVSALCAEARARGVSFVYGAAVTGLRPGVRGVTVHTDAGEVTADFAVNAAGPAAAAVAALAGVSLPVVPYRRNLVCTEAITGLPEGMPMCVDTDTGVLVRREGGGVVAGYSDPSDSPSTDTTFDPGFLEALAARAPNRFPFLADAAINPRKCWAGLYPETPDHHAIIDAPAAAPWFVQCAGFGGHGIMHSLAAGQAVAELIRDGRCTSFDLHPLRLARFDEGDLRVESAVL